MSLAREKLLKKLDRPPAAPNWVRFIGTSEEATARSIVRFAKGQPSFTYSSSYSAVRDRISLKLDRLTAKSAVLKRGSPAGRPSNVSLVDAFFDHDEIRNYSDGKVIPFDGQFFRASKEILIPVTPLTVIAERGLLCPIFLCGWTTIPLNLLQRRLLCTIAEDAFLSLTDFHNQPADFLFFPHNKEGHREKELWQRGDYELLSKAEMDEILRMFVKARGLARKILIEEPIEESVTEDKKPRDIRDEPPFPFML